MAVRAPQDPNRPALEAKAMSRLAKMRLGRAEMKRAVWPKTEIELLLRILSCEEVQACHAAAYDRFRRLNMPVDVTTYPLFEDEVLTQILAVGCRDVDRPNELPFTEDADDLRANTTVDERAAIYQVYRDFCVERDPDPEHLDPALVRQIDDLIKKKARTQLNAIGSARLVSFMLISADPPSSSPSGSSESTS